MTTPQEMTVEQIRERLDEIAPLGCGVGPVTAKALAQQQAIEAQLACARVAAQKGYPVQIRDVAILHGYFEAAHAMAALAEADPVRADEVAAQICEARRDGVGAAFRIYEHHGENAKEIVRLAQLLAAHGVADKGTIYHESVTALRKELAEDAKGFREVAHRYRSAAYQENASDSDRHAYASSLIAANYGHTLAAVLAEAARFGPEVQYGLACVADDILTNGDDEGRNADVMPTDLLTDPALD